MPTFNRKLSEKRSRWGRGKSLLSMVFLLCLTVSTALAQSGKSSSVTVSGKIVDTSGEPVVAAGVFVKNQSGGAGTGVLTDNDGKYTITVPNGSTVVVSCLGYYDASFVAKPGVNGNIVLEEDTNTLDDVVVVAYGVQRKESVVGSISQVKGDALVQTGNTNITNAIAGKFSGVTSFQTSGQPGADDATIYIRGLSSWNGSKPLIIVDGVEREWSSLDPNEVESISVLKDASATAVYGAQGANGVILVTTKTGEVSKPKMSLSATFGMDIPTNIPKHVSSYNTASAYNTYAYNVEKWTDIIPDNVLEEYRNPSSRINSIRYPDVNWFDTMLRDFSYNANANFSISGGNKKIKYYIALGYKHDDSIFKNVSLYEDNNFRYDRINFRTNLDIALTGTTDLSLKLGGYKGIRKQPSGDIDEMFRYLFKGSPMTYVPYYPDWLLDEIPDTQNPIRGDRLAASQGQPYQVSLYAPNAYARNAEGDYNQYTKSSVNLDLALNQKLDFITKGLSAQAKVSYSTDMQRTSETGSGPGVSYYIDWGQYDRGNNPWYQADGTTTVFEQTPYSQSIGSITSYDYTFYWQGSLNYARTFGNHEVTALALFSQKDYRTKTDFEYRNESLAGRVTYAYKHMYLFEGNIGYTGSEQFSPANRFGIFPSLAFGWVPSEYEFWKSAMPWWSKFKIRYSDGYVGSDAAPDRWLYFSAYSTQNGTIREGQAANSTARWELAHKRDLGIEFGFFKNALTFNVDLFDEYRTGILMEPLVTVFYASEMKAINAGELKKHGIEIEANYKRRFSNGLDFNCGAMLGFNENRIVKYIEAAHKPDYQKKTGSANGSCNDGTQLIDDGYFQSVDDIHNAVDHATASWRDGVVVPGVFKRLDYNADGLINSDDMHRIPGNSIAPMVYSLNFGFRYRRLQATATFYGTAGKYINYNVVYETPFNYDDKQIPYTALNSWTPTNKNATHAVITALNQYNFAGGGAKDASRGLVPGQTWRKSDYLTLKDLYVSYDVPVKTGAIINHLQLYMTCSNLFTIHPLPDGDPQVQTLSIGFYPMQTSVRLGVKMNI